MHPDPLAPAGKMDRSSQGCNPSSCPILFSPRRPAGPRGAAEGCTPHPTPAPSLVGNGTDVSRAQRDQATAPPTARPAPSPAPGLQAQASADSSTGEQTRTRTLAASPRSRLELRPSPPPIPPHPRPEPCSLLPSLGAGLSRGVSGSRGENQALAPAPGTGTFQAAWLIRRKTTGAPSGTSTLPRGHCRVLSTYCAPAGRQRGAVSEGRPARWSMGSFRAQRGGCRVPQGHLPAWVASEGATPTVGAQGSLSQVREREPCWGLASSGPSGEPARD